MIDKCSVCPIRIGCDWLSEMCRLTARELPVLRPDLIGASGPRKAAAQRKWRQANKAHCIAYDRQRYADNRQAEIQRQIDYQKRNPDKRAAAQKRYAEAHRDELNEKRRIRRQQGKLEI